MFIVFEGIDGAGKTSQLNLLAETLESRGREVLRTREPSDGPHGRRLRAMFGRRDELDPAGEMELFLQDRAWHVEHEVLPALRAGQVVLCDRYYYSNAAYQGAAGILEPAEILRRNAFAPRPDLALFLVLPPSEALERIREGRGERPNDFEHIDYLARVAALFAEFEDPCIRRIDARPASHTVAAAVLAEVDACTPCPARSR